MQDNDENEDINYYDRIIYHQVINAIFTWVSYFNIIFSKSNHLLLNSCRPRHSNIDERYINARLAGHNGADCNETFGACPIIDKIFKNYIQTI